MICYIGLGSNLSGKSGNPLAQLQTALAAIDNDIDLRLVGTSDYYQSEALTLPGTPPQNDYINAVASLETSLSAEQLLHKLNNIEALQGRQRNEKWAARTLDLDILLYGGQQIQTETLTIPHLQIKHRNFVIHPLFEIAGAIDIPGLGDLAALAERTSRDGLKKIKVNM